ncbi:MAG: carboxyl-terminal processing protease [Flavobacteriales bacterium]|jgi:carboxyl-terminal processing protease
MEENDQNIKVEEYIRKERTTQRGTKKPLEDGSTKWAIVLMPILLVVVAILFYNIGASKFKSAEILDREQKLSNLHEVIQLIDERYVDSVNVDDLYESSINGMLKKLDPHSAFIPRKDVLASNEQLQGHFGGVGIRFIILRDTLMITNVIEGGPSFYAGIRSGDRVVKVDGITIAGVDLAIKDVHEKLKGEFGTNVLLTVMRMGSAAEFEIPITRGNIPLPSVDASYKIAEDVGIIKLSKFSGYTDQEFDEAIVALQKQGVTKLILDLRSNGGGYMHTAVGVADQFLAKNELIVYTQGTHQPKRETFATSMGRCEKMKVAVLINSQSASASEILSGALQDNDRAIVVGRRSFGKGLVQQPIKLTDSSELRLTISRYYTPSGRSIQKPYGNGIDYENDFMDRYENGELQEIDSSIFENAEKFKTKNGRTVYGGGGIMPDIFVPIDTTGSSFYLTSLNYSSAYRDFCFDYLDRHRNQMVFKNEQDFARNFEISEELLNEFLEYASVNQSITRVESDLEHSKNRIQNYLKSEFASYLFDFGARFLVNIPLDSEVQVALKELAD